MFEQIFNNHKKLLQAIINTEEKDGKRGVLCVYDMKDDEKLLGVFYTGEKCAEFLHVPKATIYHAICEKNLVKCRFKVIRLNKGWENE